MFINVVRLGAIALAPILISFESMSKISIEDFSLKERSSLWTKLASVCVRVKSLIARGKFQVCVVSSRF